MENYLLIKDEFNKIVSYSLLIITFNKLLENKSINIYIYRLNMTFQ